MPRPHTPLRPDSVTLQKIADRAKVSCTTVSLALRNHSKISEATRVRVQALAREMGYRMHPLVSAHMAYLRTLRPQPSTGFCIAFIGDRPQRVIEADRRTQVRRYFRSARERAADLGYDLQYFNYFEAGMTGRRLSEILIARGIRGVIIAPFGEGLGRTDIQFDWRAFASAMIDHSLLQPRLHQVGNDEFSTIGRLIQRLLNEGFQRIGIAMARQMDEHANHFWLAGYQTFQSLTGRPCRIPHFITADWSKSSFLRWFRRWRPEAIITINDDIVNWLEESGVRVPADVSCATLYWKEDRPHLSGYYQNHEMIASGAVDLVVSQLNRNEQGLPESEKSMLIQAVWKEGRTIRPKSPADPKAPETLRVWKR